MTDNFNYLWTFKSKGAESAFGGNEGYPDDPQSHYVYDTTVKNYDKVVTGDKVIVAGKRNVIGVAIIEDINIEEHVSKTRFRCPICRNQEIATRKNILPRYKCRKKHEFDEPVQEEIVVTRFTAYYGSSFKPLSGIETNALKPYYINHNLYYSIQKTHLSFFQDYLSHLIDFFPNTEVMHEPHIRTVELPDTPYAPDNNDERKRKNRLQPTRKGQNKFRMDLSNIYGAVCMLTGCAVMKAMEASHINPYRGTKDNHPANGLLLRKDLHALFDYNLIGINPHMFTVQLHPSLKGSHYEELAGKKLHISRNDFGPSKDAITLRWKIFCDHCKSQNFR